MLRVQDLCFWYDTRDLPVLYNTTFALEEGQIVSVVGSSGCGKSTLLQICSGLMHDHISRFPESGHFMTGSVLWKNLPLTGPIREFGYVPQHYSGTLLRGKTALDNVLLAVKEDGISPEERERAESLMTHSGIWEQKDSKIEHLSGGQQQRVAICRALITQPGVVFMDEPFANLDDSLKPGMSRLLRDFMTELHLKLSVLLVTHDKRHAHEISNEIVELTERHGMPSSNVQSMRGPRHD